MAFVSCKMTWKFQSPFNRQCKADKLFKSENGCSDTTSGIMRGHLQAYLLKDLLETKCVAHLQFQF